MWSACYSLRVPKTKMQLVRAARNEILQLKDRWEKDDAEFDEWDIAAAVVERILNELNITLAPVIGEAK